MIRNGLDDLVASSNLSVLLLQRWNVSRFQGIHCQRGWDCTGLSRDQPDFDQRRIFRCRNICLFAVNPFLSPDPYWNLLTSMTPQFISAQKQNWWMPRVKPRGPIGPMHCLEANKEHRHRESMYRSSLVCSPSIQQPAAHQLPQHEAVSLN